MKWDSSTDRILLLAILEIHQVKMLDYEAIALKIGNGCTARAVSTQLWKLKKAAAENGSLGNTTSPRTFKKGGKLGKGNFHEDDEETKDFKPQSRPFLQHKRIKTEEWAGKIKKETRDITIKQENHDGPSYTTKGSTNIPNKASIITIDDDDDDE